jgi:hypothetical protein
MKMTNSTIQIRLTNSAGKVTEKEYQFDADDTGENAFFAAYIAASRKRGTMNITEHNAERWLYANGFHDRGDFQVQFGNGGQVDLRVVVADFANMYLARIQSELEEFRNLTEKLIAVSVTPPFILKEPK